MPEACPSDDELATLLAGRLSADESAPLHRHLRGCASCGRLLLELGAAAEVIPGGPSDEPDAARVPGDRVGRFILERLVGVGGMGAVWAARDPQLGRAVAIKLVRPSSFRAGEAARQRERLLREAKVMAHLAHPNVVPVFEVGEAGEQIFVVMELVEGETLGKWLAREHPRGEILRAFIAAGEGLAAAHGAGIVHRDFKPDNVLMGPDGRPRVTDFGLARAAAELVERALPDPAVRQPIEPGAIPAIDVASSMLTPAATLMGTPAYMAPEQLDGKAASPASDLFAFCTALYEALCGARPFAGTTLVAIREEIRAGKVREPPREKRIPDWLYRQVVSGLAADPAARPASMELLLAGLRADPERRRKQLIGLFLLALLAAGAGVLVQRAVSARAASCSGEAAIIEKAWSPGRSESMRARFTASGLPYASASFSAARELLDRYAHDWSAMRTASCEATRVRREQPEETLALRAACLDRRLGELTALTDLLVKADKKVIDRAASAASALGELETCANVTALAAPVPPPRDPATKARLDAALAKIDEAEAQRRAGVISPATLAFATPALEEIRAIGHAPSIAYAERICGGVEGRLGKHDRARELCEQALYDGTRGRDARQVIGALECLTQMVGFFLGRTDEGLRYSELALATIEGFDRREKDVVETKEVRSLVLIQAGRLDEALADRLAAIAACDKQFGAGTVVCLQQRSNSGVILTAQGRIERARATYAEVVPAMERSLGIGHPQTLLAQSNLGEALLLLGRTDEAAPILEAVVPLQSALYGEHSLYYAQALINLGELRLARGLFSEALTIEERAIAILEAIGPRHPQLSEPLTEAGLSLIGLGRAEESLPLFDRALSIAKEGSATDLARIQFALARALIALHRDAARAAELVAAGRKAFADAAARFGGENARLADELAPSPNPPPTR
jgi:tetratricopeptide (TPR) repeat protein/tRNA A-37 threonylcarbamoyl transferase component Bud32